MGEYPDFRRPDREQSRRAAHIDDAEPELSQQSRQDIAHDRGRICKKRGCVVCAPLREQRSLKKQQRRAAARAEAHAKGEPCGRSNCSIENCVSARRTAAASPPPVALSARSDARATDPSPDDPARVLRRHAERHRVGLACGSQDCQNQVCIDGFANETIRRHRAGRPCRSSACDVAICAAQRSTN